MAQEQPGQNQQSRIDFLEAALPALIQQRNEALDANVKLRAEASMQIDFLQKKLAAAEARLKDGEAAKVDHTTE